jgi:TRAP-type mannitol/chloroaromatic compound transport system substrate-binding protein
MKIRSGGGISEEMARALGASAFVKPAPESYELLSSGVADGTFFPLESIVSFKLGSVIKYATLFPGGFYGSAFGFFMNEDRWNKLSKEDQDAITSVSFEPLARLAGRAWDAADAASLQEMKRVGIQISEASPELIKGVEERAKTIIDKWVKDAAAKGVDGVKVLAEFREELASPPETNTRVHRVKIESQSPCCHGSHRASLHESWIARNVAGPVPEIVCRNQHHWKGDPHPMPARNTERRFVCAGKEP